MARFFDGTSDHIDLANEGNFDFQQNQAFSVAYWANPDVSNGGSYVTKFDDSINLGWRIIHPFADPTHVEVQLANTFGTSVDVSTTNAVLSSGFWAYAVVTYSGSGTAAGITIYVNGVSVTLTTNQDTLGGNTILNNEAVRLGAEGAGAGTVDYFFRGSLSGVGIWNVALSSGDVSSLAAGIDPTKIQNSALVAYLPLCGVASPEPDQKGQNNGTVTGTLRSGDPPFPVWCQAQDAPVLAGRGAM